MLFKKEETNPGTIGFRVKGRRHPKGIALARVGAIIAPTMMIAIGQAYVCFDMERWTFTERFEARGAEGIQQNGKRATNTQGHMVFSVGNE